MKVILDKSSLILRSENDQEEEVINKVLPLKEETVYISGFLKIEANVASIHIVKVSKPYAALVQEIRGLRQAYEGE